MSYEMSIKLTNEELKEYFNTIEDKQYFLMSDANGETIQKNNILLATLLAIAKQSVPNNFTGYKFHYINIYAAINEYVQHIQNIWIEHTKKEMKNNNNELFFCGRAFADLSYNITDNAIQSLVDNFTSDIWASLILTPMVPNDDNDYVNDDAKAYDKIDTIREMIECFNDELWETFNLMLATHFKDKITTDDDTETIESPTLTYINQSDNETGLVFKDYDDFENKI